MDRFQALKVAKARCDVCKEKAFVTAIPPQAWLCRACYYHRLLVIAERKIQSLREEPLIQIHDSQQQQLL